MYTEAAVDLDKLIPASEIRSHVEQVFERFGKPTPYFDFDLLATRISDVNTRRPVLRHLVSWILVSNCSLSSSIEWTFLPPTILSVMQSMPHVETLGMYYVNRRLSKCIMLITRCRSWRSLDLQQMSGFPLSANNAQFETDRINIPRRATKAI